MLAILITITLGLIALIVGARLLVRGASKLALSLGVSPLLSMPRTPRLGS